MSATIKTGSATMKAVPSFVESLEAPTPEPQKKDAYKLHYKGTYRMHSADGRGLISKPYEISGDVPRNAFDKKEGVKETGPIPLFLTVLSSKWMPKKYPDFPERSVRECYFLGAIDLTGAPITNHELMTYDDLCRHIEQSNLPVTSELYANAHELRAAVKEYKESPEAYVARETKLKLRKGMVATINKQLDAIDADVH